LLELLYNVFYESTLLKKKKDLFKIQEILIGLLGVRKFKLRSLGYNERGKGGAAFSPFWCKGGSIVLKNTLLRLNIAISVCRDQNYTD